MKTILIILILVFSLNLHAQKFKIGFNLTYDLYTNLDEIPGIESSWQNVYTYNPATYYYDMYDHYWPYDQLNMDISMQLGSKFLVIELIWSFTLIKGWYSVIYNNGKYVADEPVIYIPKSDKNPVFIDGDPYLYARGSGRMEQNRYGTNILLGDEVQIGTGFWWQVQRIELYKSMAFNRYWYDADYSKPLSDAYVTYNDEIYIYEPRIEIVYNKRLIVPLILRYTSGIFTSHITFIFQKPFQFLVGSGIYF